MKLVQLEEGSRGKQVQMLQHLLNTTGRCRPPLDLDGAFGPLTERAVRRYQASRRLEVDGIVGRETWGSLGARSATLPSASPVRIAPTGTPTRAVPVPSARRLAAGVAQASSRAKPAPIRRAPLLPPPGTDIGAPWMRIAIAEMHVAEYKRRGEHNKRIVEYHGATALNAKTDEVPWCASFVNWCLREAGIRGNNSARAKDFGTWGQSLEQPRYGCVVHLYKAPRRGIDGRTGSSSGNHVAFFVGQTATHIRLLGGNQGNEVRETSYPLSQYKVMAMRWPVGR